jgi:Ca2+-binding RTX toxin-like protein
VANLTTNALAVNLSAVTKGTVGYSVTNTGAASTLTGSALADTLTGGIGTDTLVGGLGNDTYIVDTTTDLISELLNGGTDTVISSVTHTSFATNVENLNLIGTAAINATGNALANAISGNAGDNTLNGGTGADTMLGGAGNDIYVVDNAGDMVYESTTTTSGIDAGGIDTVQSSLSYTLGQFVENLTLTGAAAINATWREPLESSPSFFLES